MNIIRRIEKLWWWIIVIGIYIYSNEMIGCMGGIGGGGGEGTCTNTSNTWNQHSILMLGGDSIAYYYDEVNRKLILLGAVLGQVLQLSLLDSLVTILSLNPVSVSCYTECTFRYQNTIYIVSHKPDQEYTIGYNMITKVDTIAPQQTPPATSLRNACVYQSIQYNRVYIIGGIFINNGSLSDKVYIYDGATQTWSQGPTLNYARNFPNCGMMNDYLYVMNGADENGNVTKVIERLKVNSSNSESFVVITETDDNPVLYGRAISFPYNNPKRIVVTGGRPTLTGAVSSIVKELKDYTDLNHAGWSYMPLMSIARAAHSLLYDITDNKLGVIYGDKGSNFLLDIVQELEYLELAVLNTVFSLLETVLTAGDTIIGQVNTSFTINCTGAQTQIALKDCRKKMLQNLQSITAEYLLSSNITYVGMYSVWYTESIIVSVASDQLGLLSSQKLGGKDFNDTVKCKSHHRATVRSVSYISYVGGSGKENPDSHNNGESSALVWGVVSGICALAFIGAIVTIVYCCHIRPRRRALQKANRKCVATVTVDVVAIENQNKSSQKQRHMKLRDHIVRGSD